MAASKSPIRRQRSLLSLSSAPFWTVISPPKERTGVIWATARRAADTAVCFHYALFIIPPHREPKSRHEWRFWSRNRAHPSELSLDCPRCRFSIMLTQTLWAWWLPSDSVDHPVLCWGRVGENDTHFRSSVSEEVGG